MACGKDEAKDRASISVRYVYVCMDYLQCSFRNALDIIEPHFKYIMLQQQKLLDGDCSAVLEMIAEDDTGKGDWSVHRNVRRNWKEPGLTSEAKWGVLEDQIVKLQQGSQVGQQEWAVSLGIASFIHI